MPGKETEATVIPQLRQVFRMAKAELDALAGLRDGALGYATDENILYRQNGDGAANWEAISSLAPAYTELDGTDQQAPTADSTWENFDLTGIVPVGTSVVEVHIEVDCTTNQPSGGVRADGSALARIKKITRGNADMGTFIMLCECPVSRIIEIYAFLNGAVGTSRFSIMGYWS